MCGIFMSVEEEEEEEGAVESDVTYPLFCTHLVLMKPLLVGLAHTRSAQQLADTRHFAIVLAPVGKGI